MNKERKDKLIGIFGIVLSCISLVCMKLVAYYNIVIINDLFIGSVLFALVVLGAFLSKRYFNILFGAK